MVRRNGETWDGLSVRLLSSGVLRKGPPRHKFQVALPVEGTGGNLITTVFAHRLEILVRSCGLSVVFGNTLHGVTLCKLRLRGLLAWPNRLSARTKMPSSHFCPSFFTSDLAVLTGRPLVVGKNQAQMRCQQGIRLGHVSKRPCTSLHGKP